MGEYGNDTDDGATTKAKGEKIDQSQNDDLGHLDFRHHLRNL